VLSVRLFLYLQIRSLPIVAPEIKVRLSTVDIITERIPIKNSPFGISNEVAFSPVTIEVEGNGVFLFKLFEMSDGTPIIE